MTWMEHQKMAWLLDVLIRATPAKDPEKLRLLQKARHHHALMAEDPCKRNYRPTGMDFDIKSLRR